MFFNILRVTKILYLLICIQIKSKNVYTQFPSQGPFINIAHFTQDSDISLPTRSAQNISSKLIRIFKFNNFIQQFS